jgi:hypothetical protein
MPVGQIFQNDHQTNRRQNAMTTYLLYGFPRDKAKGNDTVAILVDGDDMSADPFKTPDAIVEAIVGDAFIFHMRMNVAESIPDDCKNKLFSSLDELYARLPQLNPDRRRRRKRGAR